MLSNRIQNIMFAIAVITVMYFCFTGLARQFDPEAVTTRTRPAYTESYVEELILEKIYYEKAFKDIEGILGE